MAAVTETRTTPEPLSNGGAAEPPARRVFDNFSQLPQTKIICNSFYSSEQDNLAKIMFPLPLYFAVTRFADDISFLNCRTQQMHSLTVTASAPPHAF